jgi:hypothetical protein
MDMKPVSSRMVSNVGYKDGTLAVRFQTGREYHHTGVPQEKFDALMRSDSIGKFYNAHIRGKHPFTMREHRL